MGKLYRRIDFDPNSEDGFGELVQFVGVYVLNWHNRPDQPEVAFIEVDADGAPAVVVVVEGGLVQSTHSRIGPIKVDVIDLDLEGVDEDTEAKVRARYQKLLNDDRYQEV